MAITTAQPTGIGANNAWTYDLVGAATKYEACQSPDDDDTSYITSNATANLIQSFTSTPPDIATGDIVTQVVVRARWRQGAANPPDGRLGYSFSIHGGGTQSGTSGTFTSIPNAWTTDTYTHSGLSAAWGGNLSFFAETMINRRLRMSTLTVEITYTPSGSTHAVSKVTTLRLASKLRGLV